MTGERTISTVVRVAASASGTRSRSAAATAAWYVAYLVPSFSNVSYVCDSRLSCSGCSGACATVQASCTASQGTFRRQHSAQALMSSCQNDTDLTHGTPDANTPGCGTGTGTTLVPRSRPHHVAK